MPGRCQELRDRLAAAEARLDAHGETPPEGRGPDYGQVLQERVRAVRRAARDLAACLRGPDEPRPNASPIGWQPSVLAPVFFGTRDYGSDDGLPTRSRVYFPSLDGAVSRAPILEGCGRYPLIIFCHGMCIKDQHEHFQKWHELPATLARSGYVVAVADLGRFDTHPAQEPNILLEQVVAITNWLYEGWTHREVLLPRPALGVVGHSFGALLGARVALAVEARAYASLSGDWENWHIGNDVPHPLPILRVPKFFCWGDMEMGDLIRMEREWAADTKPRHKVVFHGGDHFDYLPPRRTMCGPQTDCAPLITMLAADLVTLFFSKYLPPERWPHLPGLIADSLVPPALSLTFEQEFYAGSHLQAFSRLGRSPDCAVTIEAATAEGHFGPLRIP